MNTPEKKEEHRLCRNCLNQLVKKKLEAKEKPHAYKSLKGFANCGKCNKLNRLFLIIYKCNTDPASHASDSLQSQELLPSTSRLFSMPKSLSSVPPRV